MEDLTSFVYKLSFEGYSVCYIGQARVPYMRYEVHIGKLKRGSHSNKHMQDFFNLTNVIPTIEILIEVTLDNIDFVEQFYIKKHLKTCFNIKHSGNLNKIGKNKYTDIQLVTGNKRNY